MQGVSERSGIFRGEDGLLYIPGSRRPDGTYRKPIRVKEGYVPQDEQPVYENKGTKWLKEKPACPGYHPEAKVLPPEDISKSTERNRKKKEARKRAAEKKSTESDQPSSVATSNVDSVSDEIAKMNVDDKPEIVDASKRIKNLKKKLAQIDALKAKIDSGELPKPDPDQLKKVQRRDEVVKEIEELESTL